VGRLLWFASNTVKAHAEKHGFELRHKKTEGNKVLAQVHKA
jgi:ribosomal protein L34